MFRNSLVYHYLYYATSKNKHLTQRLFLLVIVTVIFLYFLDGAQASSSKMSLSGLDSFYTISTMLLYFIIIFTPILIAQTIVNEKKNGTLPILSLTAYSIGKIIWARYIASSVVFFTHLAGSLPVFLLCVVIGGISAQQIIVIYSILFVLVVFAVAISFSISFLTQATSPLIVSIIFCCLTFFLYAVSLESGYPYVSLMAIFDKAIAGQISYYDYFLSSFLYLTISLILVSISVLLAKRMIYYEPKPKWRVRIAKYFLPAFLLNRVRKKRQVVFDLKNYLSLADKQKTTYKVISSMSWFLSIVIVLICFFHLEETSGHREEAALAMLTFLCMYLSICSFIYPCLAHPFTKYFELLLITKTSAKTIVAQHIKVLDTNLAILGIGYIAIIMTASYRVNSLISVLIVPVIVLPFFYVTVNIVLYNASKYKVFHRTFIASILNLFGEFFFHYFLFSIFLGIIFGFAVAIFRISDIIYLFYISIIILILKRAIKVAKKYKTKTIAKIESWTEQS